MSPAPPARPRSLLLPLGLGLALYGLLAWRFNFVCDDAYISFRYAKHLTQGEGLVFNLGESPRVEGYSNFLWVLWCALLEFLNLDVSVGSRWTSVVLGALLVWRVLAVARAQLGLGTPALLATAGFFAALPPVGMWATSGLETMATALALFVGWELLLSQPQRARGFCAGLALAVAALLRADGALFAAWILLAGGAVYWLCGRERHLLKNLSLAAAVFGLCVAAHLLWRHSYYGEWLPNTARVKAGFSLFRLERGWRYLLSFLVSVPTVLLGLLTALPYLRRQHLRLWLPALFFVGSTAAYSVFVGGDFMPFGRFLFAALPFLALLFAQGLAARGGRARPWFAAMLGLSCLGLSLAAAFDRIPFPQSWREHLHFRMDRPWMSEVERWRDMDKNLRAWDLRGKAIALHTKLGESMILGGIGIIGYHTELFIYDKYGLVTPEVVAHGNVKERKSPGHDMGVNEDFFFPQPEGSFHQKPTYLTATLVRSVVDAAQAEAPYWEELLPPEWAKHPWSRLVRIERYPLDPSQGFPENCELWLLRFHWATQ